MANPNPHPPARFTSDNQPANKGRKKSIINQLAELRGEQFKAELSKDELHGVINSLWEKSMPELKEIWDDNERPVFMRLAANAMVTDIKKGELSRFNNLMNVVYERAAAKLEVNHTGTITHVTADVCGLLEDFNRLNEERTIIEAESSVPV